MRLARFLGGGLFLGLQNLSLSAIGPRHIKVSFGLADRAMRSALSACLRKNLVSFTIVQPPAERPPPAHGGPGKFLLERRSTSPTPKEIIHQNGPGGN